MVEQDVVAPVAVYAGDRAERFLLGVVTALAFGLELVGDQHQGNHCGLLFGLLDGPDHFCLAL